MNAQAPTRKGTKTLHPPSALEGTDLELFAPIYAACAAQGIAVRQVDEMEVWEVAATLGIDMTDGDSAPARSGPAEPPPPGSLSRGRAARARAGRS